MAMRLPLRWIAILRGQIQVDLAATSGVHRATDVVKLLRAGADVARKTRTLNCSGAFVCGPITQSHSPAS
jgi:dihydroorotate dehydrogenase (fumarate)